MNKKDILKSIQFLINQGDEIMQRISNIYDSINITPHGDFTHFLIDAQNDYLKWADNIYVSSKDYGLNEGETLTLKTLTIPIIRSGYGIGINGSKAEIALKRIEDRIISVNNDLKLTAQIITSSVEQGNKIILNMSKDEGICYDTRRYPIKWGRYELIIKLNKIEETDDPLQKSDMDYANPKAQIKDINRLFKTKLRLTEDLIINLPTGGYRLNHGRYKIKFKS